MWMIWLGGHTLVSWTASFNLNIFQMEVLIKPNLCSRIARNTELAFHWGATSLPSASLWKKQIFCGCCQDASARSGSSCARQTIPHQMSAAQANLPTERQQHRNRLQVTHRTFETNKNSWGWNLAVSRSNFYFSGDAGLQIETGARAADLMTT